MIYAVPGGGPAASVEAAGPRRCSCRRAQSGAAESNGDGSPHHWQVSASEASVARLCLGESATASILSSCVYLPRNTAGVHSGSSGKSSGSGHTNTVVTHPW